MSKNYKDYFWLSYAELMTSLFLIYACIICLGNYYRAKSLYQFWKSEGIIFDKDVFEIVLAGSGWYGAGRYKNAQKEKIKDS